MILCLIVVAVFFLIVGLFYAYFWISEFIDPEAHLQNITIGSKVSVDDGFYKFDFSDVYNRIQLDNGVIEVNKNKIESVVGYKIYNSIFDGGVSECLLDLEAFKDADVISKIVSSKNSFSGHIGNENSSSKVYFEAKCDKVLEENAKLTISLSKNSVVHLAGKSLSVIDVGLINDKIWTTDEKIYVHTKKERAIDKPYKFLNYSLGSKLDLVNFDYVMHNDKKLYKVRFYGFENHGNEELEDKMDIMVENSKNNNNSVISTNDLKKIAYYEKRKNYVEPEYYYVTVNDDGFVNGIYALDVARKNHNGKNHYDSMDNCINKLDNYSKYLLTEHPLDGKFEKSYTTGETGSMLIEKYILKANDVINNIYIELECKNFSTYKGSFMLIKIEKK